MESIYTFSLLAGVVAAVVTYFSTPLVVKFAKKIDIIDDPQKNKHEKVTHTKPVPRGGGLAIFVGVVVSTILFLPTDPHIAAILAGLAILTLVGILDDKYDLNPYLRIGTGFLAAAMPIAAGIGIAFISNPLGGIIDLSTPQISFFLLGEMRSIWILSDIFALFWIVFMMNMLNMSAKGLPGQLPGVTAIAAITVALLSLQFSADITQWPVIILASVTAGAFLGFLPWNFFPQKIQPSYSGSSIAGYLLAILAILATTKTGVLLVVLAIPLADWIYSVTRRVAAGKSPVWGDRGHLHHRLLDAGLTRKQVVYLYWGATALLGLLALNLNTGGKLYTIIGITAVIGGLLLWLSKRLK
jgi:UDP-GlcNAc:undecaprenyl-phosphate GlcNAc-1-phosphate transferase